MEPFERLESEVRSYCRHFPRVFAKALDSRLIDEHGREYIDFLAGAGVLNYGHNNRRLKRRLMEYLADELLVTTQGPDERDQADDASQGAAPKDDSMLESREPGRFGKAGWTEQAGMPFWKSRSEKQPRDEKAAPPAKKRGPE